MFGFTKKRLKDFYFKKKEDLTLKISQIMFSYNSERMMSFFRKTLSNMLEFWTKLNVEELFS